MSYQPMFGALTPFFLLYCVLLGIANWVLIDRDPKVETRFRAAKAMALNHLVQPGDLEAAGEGAGKDAAKALAKVEGRYAQLPIRSGQMLDDQDFAAAPLLVATPNLVAIGLPAAGAAGNAGTVYHVCKPNADRNGETQIAEFEAGAVLCGDKARTACTAIAYLKTTEARTLLDAMPDAGSLATKTAACTASRPERPK